MKHKLPEPFRTNWIEALKSGKYKQVSGTMTRDDGYCCLGVASKLYQEMKGRYYTMSGCAFPEAGGPFAPEELYDGSEELYQELYHEEDKTVEGWLPSKLADMNDGGSDFVEIANWIEENTVGYKQ